MNKIQKKSLLLSLIVTLIIIAAIIFYLNRNMVNTPMVRVTVAAVDIPANTTITVNQLEEIYIPQKYVVKGAIAARNELVGMTTKGVILQGEQIVKARIMTGGGNEGIKSLIPKGYRATTIAVDSISGVGGHIRPGDLVDIMVYTKPPYSKVEGIKTIFQKVKVLDTGWKQTNQQFELDKPLATVNNITNPGDSFITLLMTPAEAEKLFFYNELGKVRLVLRQSLDQQVENLPGVGVDNTQ